MASAWGLCSSIHSSACASAGGSPGGTSSPWRPLSIISGMPPAAVATTGRRSASASSTAVPRPSWRLGMQNTSNQRSSAGTSVRKPGKSTRSATPSSAACAFKAGSSSPSPTTSRRASGWRSSTAGAAATRSACALCAAQWATLPITGAPAGTPNSFL